MDNILCDKWKTKYTMSWWL